MSAETIHIGWNDFETGGRFEGQAFVNLALGALWVQLHCQMNLGQLGCHLCCGRSL